MKKRMQKIKAKVKSVRIKSEIKKQQKKVPKLPPEDKKLREQVVEANEEIMNQFS